MIRLISVLALCLTMGAVQSQFFDPIMDDKAYLDNIQKNLAEELEEAKTELVIEARKVENITRSYIAAKLKENVFKALRVMAENEISKAANANALRPKSPKQETEDEDDDESTQKPTTPLTGLGTAVKVNQQVFNEIRTGLKVPTQVFHGLRVIPNQVFSFLGEAFKIIFAGGKPKAKRASSVDPAKVLLNTTQDMQILGVVSLLARDAADLPEVDLVELKLKNPVKIGGKVEKRSDDDDEELADAIIQDGRIINLFSQLLGLSKVTSGSGVSKKNETLSGFDEDKKGTANKVGADGFNIEAFVRNFRKSLGELQASVPDIYRGVREAYKLLEQVGGLASKIREYFEEL